MSRSVYVRERGKRKRAADAGWAMRAAMRGKRHYNERGGREEREAKNGRRAVTRGTRKREA